jgi:pyruvate dehydrogenase E1 component beta subunit
MVPRVQAAVETNSIDADVIDLRTLVPWDRETVRESVARTGRLVLVEEAPRSGGWGAEIVADVCGSVFDRLRAAPFRITTPDVPVPFGAELEERFLPSEEEIGRQISESLTTDRVPDPWWIREGVSQ